MVGVILVEDGNRPAVAGDVDPSQARIELDDIGSARQGKKCDGSLLIEIEHRHQFVSFAGKERAVVLRIECHAVVPFAFPDRIPAHNRIGRGIDHRKNVLVLEIDVHLARDRIVLRHPRFTLEVQRFHDLVFRHVDDGFCFAALVRHIEFVEGSGISAPVRLRFRL